MTAAFVIAVAFMVMTPGPDSLAIADAALRSRTEGIATALGATTGMLLFTIAACSGLGALLVAAPVVLEVLRLAGGSYLIVAGLTSVRRAVGESGSIAATTIACPVPDSAGAPVRRFSRGFLVDITNPKTLAVFVAVVPAFAGPDASYWTLVGHCVFLVVFAAGWFIAVALFASGIGIVGPRLARRLAIGTGGLMCGAGIAVLVLDFLSRS